MRSRSVVHANGHGSFRLYQKRRNARPVVARSGPHQQLRVPHLHPFLPDGAQDLPLVLVNCIAQSPHASHVRLEAARLLVRPPPIPQHHTVVLSQSGDQHMLVLRVPHDGSGGLDAVEVVINRRHQVCEPLDHRFWIPRVQELDVAAGGGRGEQRGRRGRPGQLGNPRPLAAKGCDQRLVVLLVAQPSLGVPEKHDTASRGGRKRCARLAGDAHGRIRLQMVERSLHPGQHAPQDAQTPVSGRDQLVPIAMNVESLAWNRAPVCHRLLGRISRARRFWRELRNVGSYRIRSIHIAQIKCH
eukprot:scaffold172_cov254-Pinguiococcus_pyrenoidosus.AAC.4